MYSQIARDPSVAPATPSVNVQSSACACSRSRLTSRRMQRATNHRPRPISAQPPRNDVSAQLISCLLVGVSGDLRVTRPAELSSTAPVPSVHVAGDEEHDDRQNRSERRNVRLPVGDDGDHEHHFRHPTRPCLHDAHGDDTYDEAGDRQDDGRNVKHRVEKLNSHSALSGLGEVLKERIAPDVLLSDVIYAL